MQVSLRLGVIEGRDVAAIVGFEFGSVKDPHELLQDESRTRVVAAEPEQIRAALMDPHRGLLGRRGSVWGTYSILLALEASFAGAPPWEHAQLMDPATLIWAARRVPEHNFRVPATTGLVVTNPLHAAVQQAVILQAAYRALKLNREFRQRKSPAAKQT